MQHSINHTTAEDHHGDATPLYLTTPEAAKHLSLAVSTLNKWRVYGEGPQFIKLGRAVRYRLEDLTAFTLSRARGSTSEG